MAVCCMALTLRKKGEKGALQVMLPRLDFTLIKDKLTAVANLEKFTFRALALPKKTEFQVKEIAKLMVHFLRLVLRK